MRVLAFGEQVERELPFPLPSTRADERGHFRLEFLPRGPLGVRVDPGDAARGGHAFVVLEIAADSSEVELVLPGDPALRGRVEDWTGRGLPGRRLEWSSQVARSSGGLESDAEGRFHLPEASEPPYIVRLYDEACTKIALTRTGTSAGEEVVFRVENSASVSGSFSDEGELFDAGERPNVFLKSAENSFAPAWEGERFTFDAVPPGRYHLWMRADARILSRSEAFELHPAEHLELPSVRIARPGELRVELSAPSVSGGTVCTTDFEVVDFVRPLDAGLGVSELQPGEWILAIFSEGLASACVPFSIRPGETTRVALALEPGVARTLGLTFADPAAAWSELADAGLYHALVSEVVERHYDPSYARSSRRDERTKLATIEMAAVDEADLDTAARRVVGVLERAAL